MEKPKLTQAQALNLLNERINSLNTTIPKLSSYSRSVKAGVDPEYEPQDLINSLNSDTVVITRAIAFLQQKLGLPVVIPATAAAAVATAVGATTPRSQPGTPTRVARRQRAPAAPRARLEVITQEKQDQLIGTTYVSIGLSARSPTARAAVLPTRDYIRIIGFTEKQVIVEPVPADVNGNLDEQWIEDHPLTEMIGKSQPNTRARLIDNNGNLSISYQQKIYSPYPEPIPITTTPIRAGYPIQPLPAENISTETRPVQIPSRAPAPVYRQTATYRQY